MPEAGDGRVLVQHLEDKHAQRGGGVPDGFPPAVAGVGEEFVDAIRAAQAGERSDLMRARVDAMIAIRGLLLVGDFSTTILTGGRVLRERL